MPSEGVDQLSLRSLAVDIMFNTGSSASQLMQIDSAVDSVKNDAVEAAGTMDELGQSSGSFFDKLGEHWGKITLAAGSAGVAIEGLAKPQKELTEQTERVAAAMGESSSEIRNAALEITNVTFPIEDVLDLMETGRQQGIKSVEQLQEYASFWDMVGDATGLAGPKLGEASVGLRAVGIAAGEEKEALAAFGYITENTTSEVDDFLSFLERTGPQLNDMGMDVNDAAAMLGILEHEFGMAGRTARSEFRKAVNEADGDMDELMKTLGISEEMFGEYKEAVEGSSDVIERNADIHGESYTAMEKLKQAASELVFQYGDIIGAASDLVPILFALGPAIKGVTLAKQLFNVTLLASPITWVTVSIVGLIAAVWALWNNWDTVSVWLSESWEWLKGVVSETFGHLWNVITGIFSSIVDWIVESWDSALEWTSSILSGIWDTVVEMFTSIVDSIREWMNNAWTTITDIWDDVMEFFQDIDLFQIGKDIIQGLIDGIANMAEKVWSKITEIGEGIKEKFSWVLEIFSPSRVFEEFGMDTMLGYTIGFEDEGQNAIDASEQTAIDISEAFNPEVDSPSGYDYPVSGDAKSRDSSSPVFNFEFHFSGTPSETEIQETARMTKREFKRMWEELQREGQIRTV